MRFPKAKDSPETQIKQDFSDKDDGKEKDKPSSLELIPQH